MKKLSSFITLIVLILAVSCNAPPEPKKKTLKEKHNYIVLLDLSDRIIVQENQPERDIEIVKHIYKLFEDKVKKDLYIKARDEVKVVIAPQKGSGISADVYEDVMYVNIESVNNFMRKKEEQARREKFESNLDALYEKARFSSDPKDYYGADIWKYFYEDLKDDYCTDTLTKNFLFILTDGYPIVGKDLAKLQPIKNNFPGLHVVLIEAAPREKDMEWDHIMTMWDEWFKEIGINNYTLIKRKAISKEKEMLTDIVSGKTVM